VSDPPLIKTEYTIYRTDGARERGAVDWPESPSLKQIHALLDPIIEGPIEHVLVLNPATVEVSAADMFVDEMGHVREGGPKSRNDAATVLYRANWLRQNPGTDPESLPWIAGAAVLFDRIIWT
jgi:hypothetical protein